METVYPREQQSNIQYLHRVSQQGFFSPFLFIHLLNLKDSARLFQCNKKKFKKTGGEEPSAETTGAQTGGHCGG